MKNWSVDEKTLKKSPQKYRLWRLEQLLSYGLGDGEKINKKILLRSWGYLRSRIDPARAEFIKFLLWA